MTTNTLGRCFLSYRRTRPDEAELLIRAFRDFGIPTWHDLGNLREEQTEEALGRAVRSPDLASAVLWITPDVVDSPYIRQIEAPPLIERARTRDGFFIVPVCAGGLGFQDAHIVVDPRFSLENVPGWNLRGVVGRRDGTRIDEDEAAAVASRVLHRRVEAIHGSLDPAEPLLLRVHSRTPPPETCDAAFVLDWRHRFDGIHASRDAWSRLLEAAQTVAEDIAALAPSRKVICEGRLSLPGAFGLGASFLQPLGVSAAWRQLHRDRDPELWRLADPADVPMTTTVVSGEVTASDLAVLVSVTHDVEAGFAASREALPPLRGILHIHAPDRKPLDLADASHAAAVARLVVDALQDAKARWRFTGTTHLFIAGPAGLAFLLGQLCNTLRPVQTYEFDYEDNGGRYHPAALVRRVQPVAPL